MNMSKYPIIAKPEWRRWATPVPLKELAVHRWYYFPHSFTNDLVCALIDEWGLDQADRILDPFCGAGTTLVAAKDKGIAATGYDLSPLAVLATKVKTSNYRVRSIRSSWLRLKSNIDPCNWNGPAKAYPLLVRNALPGKLLGAFDSIGRAIEALSCSDAERLLFQLALLRTLPVFSRAVATGGWLSWRSNHRTSTGILTEFSSRVEQMLTDLEEGGLPRRNTCIAAVGDARNLPDKDRTYSAVITSPPYPNRHDYTRVFGIELMFGFLNWSQARQLRYQSFESHPEARPKRPDIAEQYEQPAGLTRALSLLKKAGVEDRIIRMLKGYFLDSYICAREAARVCRRKARLAFVVGNVQYCGVAIPVDELFAEIGERSGLRCKTLLAVRSRGNSAQQMGLYGRNPSRESVVVFEKTC